MAELEQTSIRLIEALTDAKLRAISFDLEIQADKLKYSGWLSALATAGLAVLITDFGKVTPHCRSALSRGCARGVSRRRWIFSLDAK
jgi:hypothetical protein